MRRTMMLAGGVMALGLVAGCGGGSAGTSGSSPTSGGGGYGQPSSSAPASKAAEGGGTVVRIGAVKQGKALVDGQGKSLYYWLKDTGTTSSCFGACAGAWPPVFATGMPKAVGSAKQKLLGTTKRKDGRTQVTYNGHPLYYFAGDTGPGSSKGEESNGFGAKWYLLKPDGKKLEGD